VKGRPGSETRVKVWAASGDGLSRRSDRLATEEPLELRLVAGGHRKTLAVTMRTPGADFDLAAGWLYGEGVVADPSEIGRISYCVDRDLEEDQRFNVVNVELRASVLPELRGLERHFFTSSACGVCGKASLDALRIACREGPGAGPQVSPDVLYGLPDGLRAAQGLFDSTGGLHAAAAFSPSGELIALKEDVGRHNAVDKLVGWALRAGRLPLGRAVVMVSGRASFEILQKCVMAGVPIVCAVSAPSSLAVEVARAFGVTLVGFLRDGRFNLYTGPERVIPPHGAAPSELSG
jgi:FdhD protein